MAAPNSAYNGRSLNDQKDNIIIHHQEANITDTIEILKQRFYLDDVFINQKDGVSGFIGCCYAGSFNYMMHNPTRLGSLAKYRETTSGNGNWKSYKLFNDAGLNTLGIGELSAIVNAFSNKVQVTANYYSAFYLNSYALGIEYKKESDTIWQTAMEESGAEIPDNGSLLNKTFNFIPEGFEKDDVIYIRARIQNDEGIFNLGTILSKVVKDRTLFYSCILKGTSCASAGNNVSVFMSDNDQASLPSVPDQSTDTGIYFYRDEFQTVPATAGWYYGLYNRYSFNVDANGQVKSKYDCPIVQPTKVTIQAAYDFENNKLGPIIGTLDNPSPNNTYTITGRLDTANYNTTNGVNFSITINQGDTSGYDLVSVNKGSINTWQFLNTSVNGGLSIVKIDPH